MIIEFWIEQETKKLESDCYFAIVKINNSETMKQVKFAKQIHVPPTIQFMKNTIKSYRQMEFSAEERMKYLAQKQLEQLQNCSDIEEVKKLIGKFKSEDWQSLRGDYAHIYRAIEKQAHHILHSKEKACQ